MAKAPDDPNAPQEPPRGRKPKPARDPAKHSKKDPARPTRAKASRPDQPPTDPALAELLNPGIGQGTAGPGSQTGLKPPPDNSFDRRADFSAAHRARKSTASGFGEAPQAGYAGKGPAPADAAPAGVESELAQALGFEPDDAADSRRRGQERHHDVPRHHRRLRHRARAGDAAARGPPGIRRAAVDAAPPAAAGEIRGRPAAGDPIGLRAQGRSADRHRRPGGRRAPAGSHPGAAGGHRLRQDLHHGQGDRGDAAAGARARAQQDAGGPALRRVQELLPGQRGRVFRQLLRLLPARGLCASHRHLYREGILDQRADRPHAPQRDARLARARRRHHRRVGVVHLRHRLGRDLFGDDVHAQAGRAHRPAPAHRRSRGAAVQAQRRRLLSRRVPRARRRDRDLSRPLRGSRLAGAAVRRRDRIDPRIRSAHRAEDRRARVRQDLRQLALCDAAADAAAGDRRHQAGAEMAARPAPRRRPAAGSAAAGAAHPL